MNCQRVLTLLVVSIWYFVAVISAQAAETVVDEARGFTLTLPEGFSPHPALLATAPHVIHGFIQGDPNDDVIDTFVVVEPMGGKIGRERLRPQDMPPGFAGQLSTAKWHDFEVDVVKIPEKVGEIAMLTYNAQIPLKKGAIQVKVVGTADRDAELKQLLDQLLGSLQGESNWLKSAVPVPKVVGADNYKYVLLAVAVVIVLGGLIGLMLIADRTPKGTVLKLAVFLWIISWALPGNRIREVILLTSSLRMLGFAGGLFGIYDLIRKRKDETFVTNKSSTKQPRSSEINPE